MERVRTVIHPKKKERIWLSPSQRKRIADAFWCEYFKTRPNPGTVPELNRIRRKYGAQ